MSNLVRTRPRILVLDIETAPALVYLFQMFNISSVSIEQIKEPGRVMCAAWKWVGEKETHFGAEWQNPKWLILLYAAMSQADAIVTFNGDKFDLPKLNGEFIKLGLKRLPPVTSIDLRKTTKQFGYDSGKLAWVSLMLKIGSKLKHEGFELWVKVLAGDEKARAKMERYNRQDVKLTDRLYAKVKSYIVSHPHLNDTPAHACGACGSTKVHRRGYRRTKSFKIERLQCQGCGSWQDGTRTKVKTQSKEG